MAKKREVKREGRRICTCECGGEVRGLESFGRLFTWCEKCTPVEIVKATPLDLGRMQPPPHETTP